MYFVKSFKMQHKILINILLMFTIIVRILTNNINENSMSSANQMNWKCNNDEIMYTKDPKNCQCFYVSCESAQNKQNKFKQKFECTKSFYWDQKILTCVPYNDHCEENLNNEDIIERKSSESSPFAYPKKYSPTIKKTIIDAEICDGGVYHPDPDNCHYFIQCSNGQPFRFQCAEPLFWNQKILSCVWDSTHCTVPVFTTPNPNSREMSTKIAKSLKDTSLFIKETFKESGTYTMDTIMLTEVLTTLTEADGLTEIHGDTRTFDMSTLAATSPGTDISSFDQTTITAGTTSNDLFYDKTTNSKKDATDDEISTKSITSFSDATTSIPTTIAFENTLPVQTTEITTKQETPTNFVTDQATVTTESPTSTETLKITSSSLTYTTDDMSSDHASTSIEEIATDLPHQTTDVVTEQDMPTLFTTSTTDFSGYSDLTTIISENISSNKRIDEKGEEISTLPMKSVISYSTSDQRETSTSDLFSGTTEIITDNEMTTRSLDQTTVTTKQDTMETVTITTNQDIFTMSMKSTADANSFDQTTIVLENTSSDKSADISTISLALFTDQTTSIFKTDKATEATFEQTKITAESSPNDISRSISPSESTFEPTVMAKAKSSMEADTTMTTLSSIVLDPKICLNGQTYHSDPYDKQYFVQCANGIPQRFQCTEPYTWNQNALSCVWIEQKCFTQIRTLPNLFHSNENPTTSIMPTQLSVHCYFDDTFIPDLNDCHVFYHCINGVPLKKICPNNQFWDPQLLSCSWNDQNCNTNNEAPTKLTTTTAISRTIKMSKPTAMASFIRMPFISSGQSKWKTSYNKKVKCYPGDTYLPDPSNCHVFYHCGNGVPFKKLCPSNLFWDPELLICNWSDQNCYVNSKAATTTAPPMEGAIEYIESTTESLFTHNKPFVKPGQNKLKTSYPKKLKCNPGDIYLPDPNNCNIFYHCSNGIPFKKQCPSQLVWDQTLFICTWNSNNC